MKLVSMTEFVLEQINLLYTAKISQDQYVTKTKKYADFLKNPLTIGMFVPCDELGNVLTDNDNTCQYDFEVLQQAKERVLFEGFQVVENKGVSGVSVCKGKYKAVYSFWSNGNSINPLLKIEDIIIGDVTLTQQAIKQIGG